MDKVEKLNEYTFLVDPGMTKFQIEKLIRETFGFKPLNVATKTKRSQSKKVGKSRRLAYSSGAKYAIVKLSSKEKIALFDIKEKKG